jgi:hypothetical protein
MTEVVRMVAQYNQVGDTNISQEHTASTFTALDYDTPNRLAIIDRTECGHISEDCHFKLRYDSNYLDAGYPDRQLSGSA